ncbi:glutamine synthetase [candidate division KSB1 bacterium]|nr:glutamine synthetase [candidate division KSB1 bacterium]NIR71574.1 glutamine synthetase [candidate division KSB1 bacterium]NIS27956.1 glutamine synthetase [candidate division KSB1 bacterium]NIT74837.1 glutamine synthetase [candidate division KSB1 bacterium]NIU28613.1 glutamine synthetase [candidate division KSB1 bacterium]
MELRDKNDVLKVAKENNIRFIRLWFTDILGFLKSFAITIKELEPALEEGAGFDGSSIEGFVRIDESDMVAMPDPSTFQILPWKHSEESTVACVFCDIYTPEGEHFEGDPRWVLKKNLKRAADLGYTFYVGPELEYFYFKSSDGMPETLDSGGYFDLTPLDVASDFRKQTVVALEALGIEVETSHHEVGPSQHEIDLRYTDALKMADNAMTYRLVVKEVALRNNIYATFMPKPLFGQNGSGMHTHMSLFKGERNAFFDANDKHHLSDAGKQYIAGLIKHAPEFTLVTNQWVNSYKRLVPGYEAPVYTTWAVRNRSDMIRVPAYKLGQENATRIELRSPDPACNPYLAFSAMLAAGLEGIEKNYKPIPPVERNVYALNEKERDELKIDTLPEDLFEAIKAMESSELMKKALGEYVFNTLLENKRLEWEDYRAQLSQWEMVNYFPVL